MALFDFDGTISVIRSGWVDVMAPDDGGDSSGFENRRIRGGLRTLIQEMIWRTTGKETIYQMMDFADHVTKRGGAGAGSRECTRRCIWTGCGR